MASGRCNCSKFEFTVPKAQSPKLICFCKSCVRAGGSIGSNNAVIDYNQMEFKSGSFKELNFYEDKETDSGNPINRHFCGNCGSAIISIPKGSKDIGFFKVSSLNEPDQYLPGNPGAMIFNERTPGWMKDALTSSPPEGVEVKARGG